MNSQTTRQPAITVPSVSISLLPKAAGMMFSRSMRRPAAKSKVLNGQMA